MIRIFYIELNTRVENSLNLINSETAVGRQDEALGWDRLTL
jgi:hypothetical protein